MNMVEIERSLNEQFNLPLKDEEIRKIIFWTDYDHEFIDEYQKLDLADVKIIHLTNKNQFAIKHLIEEEDPTSSFLIYTEIDLESEDNWLYDTYMYGQTFYADRLSLVMNDLGINQSLRPTIEKYARFFASKERIRRLKLINISSYTVEKIELGMMNALCKTHSVDFATVLREVLMDSLDDEANIYLSEIEKYFSLETFWDYVRRHYSYDCEEKTLKTLFIHLVMTAATRSIDEEFLGAYDSFIANENQTNAYVFIDHWQNHRTDLSSYHDYILSIEKELKIMETINELPIETIKHLDVFPCVDQVISTYIGEGLKNKQEDFDRYLELIHIRRTKHFYDYYRSVYEVLHYAVKIYQFKHQHHHGIAKDQAVNMYNTYTDDYYLMDYYYRKFYVAFDKDNQNELLQEVRKAIEYIYTEWFMRDLNIHWSEAVRNKLADNWSLPTHTEQKKFYSTHVAPHINANERVFVIISDALRYEAGKELQTEIQEKIIGDCQLEAMIGVVPSVTKLGMAALLPHQELTIDEKANVLVNGRSTTGIDNRRKIISNSNKASSVLHYDELVAMNIDEQREEFKGKKLIYVYHDTIDAIGDNPSTEIETFDAVERAVEQLSELVRSLTNNISATNIYITADHGFLYERDKLVASDLMKQSELENALETSRRYVLSHEKKEVSGLQTINLSNIIDNEEALYAHVPNANIRYRVQGGGANFVHGGASLQEIVIPLLTIKNKRRGQAGARITEKVDVALTSTMRRITNSIFTLEFFQKERVSDDHIARSLSIYLIDEEEKMISNEEKIIADLPSKDPKERMYTIRFALKNQLYDRNKTYYLVLKDIETNFVIERIPFTISLGIVSDFDF